MKAIERIDKLSTVSPDPFDQRLMDIKSTSSGGKIASISWWKGLPKDDFSFALEIIY